MVNIAILQRHNLILNFGLGGHLSTFRVKNTLNGRYFKFKIIPKQLLKNTEQHSQEPQKGFFGI